VGVAGLEVGVSKSDHTKFIYGEDDDNDSNILIHSPDSSQVYSISSSLLSSMYAAHRIISFKPAWAY